MPRQRSGESEVSITRQQGTHLHDLRGTGFTEVERTHKSIEKLAFGSGDHTIAVNQLTGQAKRCFLLLWRQNGSRCGDQSLPGLLTETLQEA